MKIRILLAALATTFASGAALADEASPAGVDLCRHGAVREAIRLEHDLRPVKELYDIATNPTGFVIKTVTREAGIKIPRFVGYAMDPQGSLRASAMKRVRNEVRKQTGLQDDCRAEAVEIGNEDGPFPTPEADASDAQARGAGLGMRLELRTVA